MQQLLEKKIKERYENIRSRNRQEMHMKINEVGTDRFGQTCFQNENFPLIFLKLN